MNTKEIREDGPYAATPHAELMRRLHDSRVPKTELEHAAKREVDRLHEALEVIASDPLDQWGVAIAQAALNPKEEHTKCEH